MEKKVKDKSLEFTPESIRDYIISRLSKNCDFLFNELDLQMFVARALADKFKDGYRIYLEYRLPKYWNANFDKDYSRWGETPYFDIVVEDSKKQKFIAIELKYKLGEVPLDPNSSFTRFGTSCPVDEEIKLVTDQSAQNEGRYDFWKDVKRLELLGEHFENVVGGVAVFVTNDKTYHKIQGNFKYSQFAFNDKKENSFLYWNHDANRCKRICPSSKEDFPQCGNWKECHYCGECGKLGKAERPNFTLHKSYKGLWHGEKEDDMGYKYLNTWQNEFFYCYSVIIQSPSANSSFAECSERL